MKHLYFISYNFDGSDMAGRIYGSGNKTMLLDRKITTIEQLEKIQENIKKENGFSNVVIISFDFLKIVADRENGIKHVLKTIIQK